MDTVVRLPSLPRLGLDSKTYAKLIKDADTTGDTHRHEAIKVAQYITLAVNPAVPWVEKLRFFDHALRRHCHGPDCGCDAVQAFYAKLATLTREHCGREAMLLASRTDDLFAARVSMGQDKTAIEGEAEEFFGQLMGFGDVCPDHFLQQDWDQLKVMRDTWI